MPDRTYLDWNATAPLRPEARAAMIEAMDVVGNPSSVHTEGRAAKAIVEKAREQVAALVGCDREDVVFTSGATEAAFSALSCLDRVVYTIGPLDQHDCIHGNLLNSSEFEGVGPERIQGFRVVWTRASGETGVLNNGLEDCGYSQEYIKANYGGNFSISNCIIDAVQAIGKINYSFSNLSNTMIFCSGHKFGSPKGVGSLFVGAHTNYEMVVKHKGGGQENGRRSGTENVIGIAGFGAAAKAAKRDLEAGVWEGVAALRDDLESALRDCAGDDLIIFGENAPRLPNTSCFAVPGWKGETQVMQLDLAGFAVSAGSACSSGKVGPSRVLKAMGFDDITASSAIRVSMGPTTTKDEVSRFIDAWTGLYKRMKTRAA